MFWSRSACLYRVFTLSISACFKFGSQTATKYQAVTFSLPTGWHITPSSSRLDRIRASRCGGWRTSTWCLSQRTCMGVFTPATPTSSWTQSNSALGTCSTISTSGWVSEGVKSGRPESAANATQREWTLAFRSFRWTIIKTHFSSRLRCNQKLTMWLCRPKNMLQQ